MVNNENEMKPEEIQPQLDPEEYVTMKRKEYDVLKQSSDLARQAAEISLKSMIESEDQRIVLLAESMMHSWNILQTIISSKKNIQSTAQGFNQNTEIMKQG